MEKVTHEGEILREIRELFARVKALEKRVALDLGHREPFPGGFPALIALETPQIQDVPVEIPQAVYLQGVWEYNDQIVKLINFTQLYASSELPEPRERATDEDSP